MENFKKCASIFAILTPANNAARDSFSQVAQKKLDDKDWNPHARQNIMAEQQPTQVSTYSSGSESDGGTEPSKTLRPVLKGCYTFDLDKPPTQPDKGWIIGGGKFSGSDLRPEILLTERRKLNGVSSRHARLAHNFASGALVITATDNSVILINGHEVVDGQRVVHGRITSLEFGSLKYTLEIRTYDADEDYRNHLRSYKQKHGIADDDYPSCLLATPADLDLVYQNYVVKNIVGHGATCVVYAAHERRNGDAVAVKRIRRTWKNAKIIKRDISITTYIGKHPRICHLIDVIDPSAKDPNRGYQTLGVDEIFLVYVPLANWTVQGLIDNNVVLDVHTLDEIFWQLLEGLEYLHSMEIMHRDIKPKNMTVVSMDPRHPEARLIDFGLATKGLESYEYMVGTVPYLAPEMWAGYEGKTNSPYSERVDIFAFGLSMYQLFCLQPCGWNRIDKDANGDVNCSILLEIERRLLAIRYRNRLVALVCTMISWDPQQRPSAREVIRLGGRKPLSVTGDAEGKAVKNGAENVAVEGRPDEVENYMGKMMVSGPGRTSCDRSSREGGSGEGSGDMTYKPCPHHKSSPAKDPRSWNPPENERAYQSAPFGT